MTTAAIKRLLLPTKPRSVRVLRGPFRGAHLWLKPADSLRKILGLYEHELNSWLELALRRIDNVIDVGANDGYFTFGCATALVRLGRSGCVVAIEPDPQSYEQLLWSKREWEARSHAGVRIALEQVAVGGPESPDRVTLPSLLTKNPVDSGSCLIKIDVEGAELEVLDGAAELMVGSNLFLIEVHRSADLAEIIERFRSRGLELERVRQQPLPLIGREMRNEENSWVVSRI